MSKTYGMAGWRIGFVVGNAEIVERINLLNDHERVGIFEPLQRATIAALEGPQESVVERVATYERRRDLLAGALAAPIVCEGTFFVWLRLPEGLDRRAPARGAPRRGRARRRLRAERRRLGAHLARRRRRRARARRRAARRSVRGSDRVKIGIIVPFSWSYWGGVVEHAEHQAAALRRRGHDVEIVMGNDPPGKFTRFLHPRSGRHGPLPDGDHRRSAARSSCRRTARCRTSSSRRAPSAGCAPCSTSTSSTSSTCTSR